MIIMYLVFISCPTTLKSTATFSSVFFRSSKVPSHFTGRQKCAVDDHVADDALGGHGVQQGGGLTPMASASGQCCHDISETGHVWYRTMLKPQKAAAGEDICDTFAEDDDYDMWFWDIMTYAKFYMLSPSNWIQTYNSSWFGFMITLSLVDTSTKASISAPPGHISCSTASGKLQRFVEEQAWRMLLQKNVSSESPGDPHENCSFWKRWKHSFWEFFEKMSTSRLVLGFLNNNRNKGTTVALRRYQKKHIFCVWAVWWLLVMSLWYFVEGQLTLRNTFIVLGVVSVHLRCVELAATHVSQGTCVSTLRTHQWKNIFPHPVSKARLCHGWRIQTWRPETSCRKLERFQLSLRDFLFA